MIGLDQNPGYETLKSMNEKTYNYLQETPSKSWCIQHNRGTSSVIINVMGMDDLPISPLSYWITIFDKNNVRISFDEAMSGKAIFVLSKENSQPWGLEKSSTELEVEMAHQAEDNAFRNRDAAIAENDQLKQRIERLEAICACAYQMAGAYDAPVRFLDALSLHDDFMGMTPDEIIDALLPVVMECPHGV